MDGGGGRHRGGGRRVALLFGDRRETFQGQAIGATRGAFDTRRPSRSRRRLAAPVRWAGDGVNGVNQYFFAVSENRQLQARGRASEQWRDKAVGAAQRQRPLPRPAGPEDRPADPDGRAPG